MTIDDVIITAIAAFAGSISAVIFQYWRENSHEQRTRESLLKQAVAHCAVDLATIEVALDFANEGRLNDSSGLPAAFPPMALSATIADRLAGFVPGHIYMALVTARHVYASASWSAGDLLDSYREFERRSLGTGRSMNKYEINVLDKQAERYRSILHGGVVQFKKGYGLLEDFMVSKPNGIRNRDGSLRYGAGLYIVYILLASHAAFVFFLLWQKGC